MRHLSACMEFCAPRCDRCLVSSGSHAWQEQPHATGPCSAHQKPMTGHSSTDCYAQPGLGCSTARPYKQHCPYTEPSSTFRRLQPHATRHTPATCARGGRTPILLHPTLELTGELGASTIQKRTADTHGVPVCWKPHPRSRRWTWGSSGQRCTAHTRHRTR